MTATLAFDTSSSQVSVAVAEYQEVVAEARSTSPMRHGEELAPLIRRVLLEAGMTPRDLACIVVGVGPGPFTGLRVGIVTALTMGHAIDIPVDGVCSLDILALDMVSRHSPVEGWGVNQPSGLGRPNVSKPASSSTSDRFRVLADARRKEVYWADYSVTADGLHRHAGPAVDRPEDIGEAPYADLLFTPPSATTLAHGVLTGALQRIPVQPLYLRRPDAEGSYR